MRMIISVYCVEKPDKIPFVPKLFNRAYEGMVTLREVEF